MQAARTRRLSTLCLIVAYVAALFQGTAHEALTRHVVCSDHGDLVHVADVGDHHAASEGSRSEVPTLHGADPAGDEHDHCPFLVSLRQDDVFEAPIVPTALGPAVRGDAPTASPRVSGVPLFRLAPKQSPPA